MPCVPIWPSKASWHVGPAHVGRRAAIIKCDDGVLSPEVRELARLPLAQIAGLVGKIAGLDAELRRRVTTDDTARRRTTIPGLGPGSGGGDCGGDHDLCAADGDRFEGA